MDKRNDPSRHFQNQSTKFHEKRIFKDSGYHTVTVSVGRCRYLGVIKTTIRASGSDFKFSGASFSPRSSPQNI
jgi:hypothetical protein